MKLFHTQGQPEQPRATLRGIFWAPTEKLTWPESEAGQEAGPCTLLPPPNPARPLTSCGGCSSSSSMAARRLRRDQWSLRRYSYASSPGALAATGLDNYLQGAQVGLMPLS